MKRITSLYVGGKEDMFIWTYTKHGSYKIKNGYWLIANQEARRQINRSPLDLQQIKLKRRVWKMATIPKIKMFLWRVLSGAVAMVDHLNSMGLNVTPICQFCKLPPDSINHVLFLCDPTINTWLLSSVPMPSTDFSNS